MEAKASKHASKCEHACARARVCLSLSLGVPKPKPRCSHMERRSGALCGGGAGMEASQGEASQKKVGAEAGCSVVCG
jgi:hypothetical protein